MMYRTYSMWISFSVAGVIALSRWFHPATFTQATLWFWLAAGFIAALSLLLAPPQNDA